MSVLYPVHLEVAKPEMRITSVSLVQVKHLPWLFCAALMARTNKSSPHGPMLPSTQNYVNVTVCT